MICYLDENGHVTDEKGYPHSLEDVRTVYAACKRYLRRMTPEKVKAAQDQWEEDFFKKMSAPAPVFRKPLRGFVYLMENKRNGFYKIGFSKKPKIRELTLQAEEPEIILLWSIEGTLDTEAALQRCFKNKRIRGEWFSLSAKDVQSICSSK